eukprot:273450_1
MNNNSDNPRKSRKRRRPSDGDNEFHLEIGDNANFPNGLANVNNHHTNTDSQNNNNNSNNQPNTPPTNLAAQPQEITEEKEGYNVPVTSVDIVDSIKRNGVNIFDSAINVVQLDDLFHAIYTV